MEATGAALSLARSLFPAVPAAASDARALFAASGGRRRRAAVVPMVVAMEKGSGASGNGAKKSGSGGGAGVPNSNYVVPLDLAPSFCRPLKEILRDLNKRVPDNIINLDDNSIPWYHANRMLSFYAPGWCGEVRDVLFLDNGNVTVVYRVTIRGLDGEVLFVLPSVRSNTNPLYLCRQYDAICLDSSHFFELFGRNILVIKAHRESTGTVSLRDGRFKDPVAAAEEIAFCKACARFGFGLYLYHEDETV